MYLAILFKSWKILDIPSTSTISLSCHVRFIISKMLLRVHTKIWFQARVILHFYPAALWRWKNNLMECKRFWTHTRMSFNLSFNQVVIHIYSRLQVFKNNLYYMKSPAFLLFVCLLVHRIHSYIIINFIIMCII